MFKHRATSSSRPVCCHVFQKSACIVDSGPLDRVCPDTLTGYRSTMARAGTLTGCELGQLLPMGWAI